MAKITNEELNKIMNFTKSWLLEWEDLPDVFSFVVGVKKDEKHEYGVVYSYVKKED